MPATLTTGMFPVAQLPAAQVVSVRIYLTNLENRPHRGVVEVSRLVGQEKERFRLQEVEVPPDERVWIELSSDEVEGETVEVTVTVPTDGFGVNAFPLVPSVAVVSLFTGDGSTSVLQWISTDGFAVVARANADDASTVNEICYK